MFPVKEAVAILISINSILLSYFSTFQIKDFMLFFDLFFKCNSVYKEFNPGQTIPIAWDKKNLLGMVFILKTECQIRLYSESG